MTSDTLASLGSVVLSYAPPGIHLGLVASTENDGIDVRMFHGERQWRRSISGLWVQSRDPGRAFVDTAERIIDWAKAFRLAAFNPMRFGRPWQAFGKERPWRRFGR